MLFTKSDFARHVGVTRQSINGAVKRGQIVVEGEGREARIDTDNYINSQYIHNRTKNQRKGPAEKIALEAKKEGKRRRERQKKTEQKEIITESSDSISITIPKGNGHSDSIEDLIEIAERLEIAKTQKMEEQVVSERLKNAKMRGDLVDKELIYNRIFLYLDKLHSNLERLADSYLSDLGGRIVDAEKVLPEHRMEWKNEVMSQIDAAKIEISQRIRDVQEAQA